MAYSRSETGKVQGKPVISCVRKQERTQRSEDRVQRTQGQREEAPTGQFLEV